MIEDLIDEIIMYIQYLQSCHNDYIAFHNNCIPLEGFLSKLAPYTINSNPYCLYVKTHEEVWNYCKQRQKKVVNACSEGAFCGTCYAGMGEYVFPILDSEAAVLGFISAGGYRVDDAQSFRKIKRFSNRYRFDREELEKLYLQNVTECPEDIRLLKARIAPLCRMFALLCQELKILPGHSLENQTQGSTLGHAIVYLRKHYTQDIHAEDIAGFCHCSVSGLSHLFKKNTGKSISEYIRDLRIDNAKKLLCHTDLSIGQISDALGFGHQNYFCRVFRQIEGMSPSSYRTQRGGA